MHVFQFLSVPLLCSFLIQLEALPSPPEEGVDPPPAEASTGRVHGILEELERDWEHGQLTGKSYHLTEAELNTYLSSQLQQQRIGAVKDLSLSLKEGGLSVGLMIDPDRLGLQAEPLTSSMLGWLLGTTPSLEVEGQLQSQNGRGSFRMEKTLLNGMPLPTGLIEKLLERVGSRQDFPLDLSKSFELPYGLESITCHPGSVTLQAGSPEEP